MMTKTKTKSPTLTILPMPKTVEDKILKPLLRKNPQECLKKAKEHKAFYLCTDYNQRLSDGKMESFNLLSFRQPKIQIVWEPEGKISYSWANMIQVSQRGPRIASGVVYKISTARVRALLATPRDISATQVLPMPKTYIRRFLRPFLKGIPGTVDEAASIFGAFYLVKEFRRNPATGTLEPMVSLFRKVPKKEQPTESDRPVIYKLDGFLDWIPSQTAKHYFPSGVAYKISSKEVRRLLEELF